MDTEQTRHTTASLDPDLPIERSAFVVVDRDGTAPHRFIQYGAGSDPNAIVCAVYGCPTDEVVALPLAGQLRHPIHAAASYAAGLIEHPALTAAEQFAVPNEVDPRVDQVDGPMVAIDFSRAALRALDGATVAIEVVDPEGPHPSLNFTTTDGPLESHDRRRVWIGPAQPGSMISFDRDAIIRQNALDAVEAAKIRSDAVRDLATLVRRAVHREYERDVDVARDDLPLRIRTAIEIVIEDEEARVTDAEEDARRYVAALDERRDGVDRSEIPF